MKAKISLALSLASAAVLTASTIEWELPNLTSGEDALTPTADSIVFFIADSASYNSENGTFSNVSLADGSSNVVDYTSGDYVAGTYSDNVDSGSVTYAMAYYDASSSTYYAISDGTDSGYVTVTVNNDNYDPRLPGGGNTGSYAPEAATVSTVSSSVTSPAVPEPATAALAFVGVAMLIRRRRAA